MSDTESSSVRLEDGEIDDEGNEPSPVVAIVTAPGTSTSVTASTSDCGRMGGHTLPSCGDDEMATVIEKSENDEKTSIKNATLDDSDCKQPVSSSSLPTSYQIKDGDSEIFDEDEMLCVRGASPLPLAADYSRSPAYDSDTFSMDIISPKRRKTAEKRRRRKRAMPKKVLKDIKISSDDQHDSKGIDGNLSPSLPKLQQLCKFYLQGCCAKGPSCEYMHSEFPCKFFYMGLKCEDEESKGKCKLSHGGTLSYQMLVALIRHIHTAPNDVLGKKFVKLRAKMPIGEASKMLHQMQEKLQTPDKHPEEVEAPTTEGTPNFVETLREKLYFLSEEQIDKLQQLRISKVEDLLYLTLAQLNAIGIHAIQIEAIQMSLIAGQDMDMRNIFPAPVVAPAKPVEVVAPVKDTEMDQSWYEDEEQPLVIDESEELDIDEERDKDDADDDGGVDLEIPSTSLSVQNLEKPDDSVKDSSTALSSKDIQEVKDIIDENWSDIDDFEEDMDKVLSNDAAKSQTVSSPDDQSWKYFVPSEPKAKEGPPMQGDISSDSWEVEELAPQQSVSKQIDCIDSPDNSEDEATTLVASGTCPEFPLRTPNLDNYKPALEIDAHLTYPAMEYKLYEIHMPDCEVNRPPLMDKLLKSNTTDPRLKKFIEKEKNHGIFPQTDYSFFPPTMSQCDPRLRPGYGNTCPEQHYNASPILYGYLQRSLWYQELKSNLKIQINHSVSDLVRALNAFHKDPAPKKIFDLFQIECAGVLLEVMRNVGIFIDVNGNITEESNYQQLCAPQQPSQPYTTTNSNNNSNNNTTPAASTGAPLKPGLLGYAPPGVTYSPLPHMPPTNVENDFMRQAFGYDYFGNNNNSNGNNSEFPPSPGSGFYVGERNFNRNRGGTSNFDPAFRRPPKRNFKRPL